MTIAFQTPGVMDIDAAMTFGHTSKKTANPIGYFGTGLKYAIAVILRNGGTITINTGGKTHGFSIKSKPDHNGNQCHSVFMGNVNLRFTPNLGRNWEAWQAFRELYCNTKDESGETTNRMLRPRSGFTTINVSGWDKFDEAFARRKEFFLEDSKPFFRSALCEVHRGETDAVYYRGILVHRQPPEARLSFTYNLTGSVQLTEDRTLKYSHSVGHMIGYTVLTSSDKDFIRDFLLAERGTLEQTIQLDQIGYDPSETFLDMVQELRRGPEVGKVNKSALDMLDKARPVNDETEAVPLTEQQAAQLEKALALLEHRFPDIRKVPLIPVATLGSGVYGLARRGKAYISLRCFEAGFVQLVGTIFEEYSHITKDFRDESRDFQNYLINLVAQLLEERYDDELRADMGLPRAPAVAPDAATS